MFFFQPKLVKDVAFKEWLIPASDRANASCKFCKINIRYDTRGAKARDEHLMSKKHSENRSLHISSFDTVPSIFFFFRAGSFLFNKNEDFSEKGGGASEIWTFFCVRQRFGLLKSV